MNIGCGITCQEGACGAAVFALGAWGGGFSVFFGFGIGLVCFGCCGGMN